MTKPGERIKLLIMVTNFKIGGTERQFTNLAMTIDSSRFDLHLGCLQNYGELLAEIETLNIPRPEFHIASLYGPKTLWQTLRLARYIRRHSIQVVHSYGFYANVFSVPAARLAGTPFVVASIRDTGDILTALQRRVQRTICWFAHCVLVNAEAIRQVLIEEGYNPRKIVVIRNGIVMSRFEKQQKGSALRQGLGLSPSHRIVLVSSRLNQMKGIEYFLDAAAVVARTFPDVRFLVVGDGAHRKELEERCRRLGLEQKTMFTGFRTDVPELLAETTLSVLPSLSEGLSNSLLESMASGVAVIAATVGGNPEIIEDGVSGLLVPPRDAEALAEAMIKLLADPDLRARYGRAGKRRVSEVFSMGRSVGDTERLYERLLKVRVCA
jgi:glycosyltransferase involved in cell wall biosynthesis